MLKLSLKLAIKDYSMFRLRCITLHLSPNHCICCTKKGMLIHYMFIYNKKKHFIYYFLYFIFCCCFYSSNLKDFNYLVSMTMASYCLMNILLGLDVNAILVLSYNLLQIYISLNKCY